MPHALPPDLTLVRACEERIVNCWPAIEAMLVGDFILRFAHGYSGRANSASPLCAGATLTEAEIDHVEALYRKAGLPPIFRATPLMAQEMRARLAARGYRPKDTSTGMIRDRHADVPTPGNDAAITIGFATTPHADWLDGISRYQIPEKRAPQHLRAIVERIRVPACFVTMRAAGTPIAFGLLAIDRGMAELASIMLDPAFRGQGHGRRLTQAMLEKASAAGAPTAFLQVASDNPIARRLYESLGFRDCYAYETLWLKP